MSYANGTTYYNLPQTVGTDKRDWADTNQAFADVDAALHTASETASEAATDIDALQTTVADIQTAVSGLTTTVNSHTSSIATINETLQLINTALTQLNTNVATKFNSVSIADAYDPTSTYSVDDVVTYAGDRYKCVTAVTTGEPFDADKWVGEDVQTVLSQINSGLNDKLNTSEFTKHTLGSEVALSSADPYTVPNDGYIIASVANGSGSAIAVQVDGIGLLVVTNDATNMARGSVFVKAGMVITLTTYGSDAKTCSFRPLT